MEISNEQIINQYKVIADYPNSAFKIGTILTLVKGSNNLYKDTSSQATSFIELEDIKSFPNIFQEIN